MFIRLTPYKVVCDNCASEKVIFVAYNAGRISKNDLPDNWAFIPNPLTVGLGRQIACRYNCAQKLKDKR
jgi:hypothetical protein